MSNDSEKVSRFHGVSRPHGLKHRVVPLLSQGSSEKSNLPTCIKKALINTEDQHIARILDRLRSGEVLSTVRRGRLVGGQQTRFCRLDKDLLYFRYGFVGCGCKIPFGRKREKKVDLRHIRIRLGLQESSINNRITVKSSNYFSIVFDNSSRLPLSFITRDDQSASDWVAGLNYLKRQITNLQPRLQFEFEITAAWELFNTSDLNSDGNVTFSEATRFLIGHDGLSVTKDVISQYMVQNRPESNETLPFQSFFELYQDTTVRPEISEIFNQISADRFSITVRELYKFIQETQREDRITEKECEQLILDYEVNDVMRMERQMSLRGFNLYVTSYYCELFNWRHDVVYQDMNQPLSHYYIASSHNTYLTGDQLTEPSSVESYMNVLLKGCRCVELDCWDGPDGEPLIYHGYTLTSKLKFKDVIKVIGRYAFEASQYPLILSLENHCCMTQQKKMAGYLKTILGSELLTSPLLPQEEACALPSPSALRGKILIKGKTIPQKKSVSVTDEIEDFKDETEPPNVIWAEKPTQQGFFKTSFKRNKSNTSSISSSASGSSNNCAPSWKLSKDLSDLVIYCKSVKFTSLDPSPNDIYEISSFSEKGWKRLVKTDKDKVVDYHKRKLSRIYPAGSRTDSSNFDPQPSWNAGCQLVALNYQTKCDEMEINNGKFRQNGNCGYILKPSFQRLSQNCKNFDVFAAKLLKIHVISGLDMGKIGKRENLTMEVLVSGDTDDNQENELKWTEDISLIVRKPELAMVRFILKNKSRMRERVGQYTLPFTSVAQGYRHIPFLDCDGAKVPGISLFVKILIDDVTKEHAAQSRVIRKNTSFRFPSYISNNSPAI